MRKYLRKLLSSILVVILFTIFVFAVLFGVLGVVALMDFLLEKPVSLLVDALISTNYISYIVMAVIVGLACIFIVVKEE